MAHESNPKQLSLTDLADLCAQETERFFKRQIHDPAYCFELFRRAIREDDQYAWELIYNQYESLVAGWVKQHQSLVATGEDVQYFVIGAFGKISKILTAEKFNRFSDLQSLLYYLKMCVHSVITDYNRVVQRTNQNISFEEVKTQVQSPEPAIEDEVSERVDSQTFWVWISEKLHDEKERIVVQGVFVLDLKPRELCDHYEHLFTDVNEVYRIKQNILARLRRDSEFRRFFGGDD